MELKNQRITSILLICIFVILLLSIIITPTTFYRAQWSYSNIVGSEIIKESTYIEMPSSEEHPYLYIIYGKLINQIEQCPGIPLLLGIISLVTGLEVLEIYNFFPLGEILFVLSSFFIANIFFKGDKKKTTILALFSAIGIFGPSMLRIDFHVLQTSIMAFSFAVTLWATHKDMLNNEFKNISFIIFLLLINRLIYFSSSIFFYVFLVSFSLILFIFSFYEKGKRNNIQLHALIYTALALLMLFTWSELNLFDYLIDQTTVLILAILGITLILLIFLIILSLIKREDLIILTKKINDNLINNLKYIILLGLIFTPVFLIIGTSYFSLIESIFINRIFSIIFIIPSLFILPYILRDYLNKKNTEQNIIYLASLLSLFSMLPFSLYMPYLITRGFVFLQIIFFVGAILFISNYGKIKDNWKNFIFLIIVFFLLLNNFTYLLSDDNNYGSSNDIRIKEGLSLFLEQITEEDKISSDLKVLSNSLVLGHENSYLPFTSESDSEFEELLNRIFYYNNPEEIYQELKDNGVDYFILTEEMTKYGIYVHDYQHPAISEELINILKEDERFNLVFDNEGLFIFQLT